MTKNEVEQLTLFNIEDIDGPEPVRARDVHSALSELLKDYTTDGNIMFATDNYADNGFDFYDEITPEVINHADNMIILRVLKTKDAQKKRTKSKAEVFTPVWVVKKMNDTVDAEYDGYGLDEYLNVTWLEITCGEAPYMCTRYDTVSGEPIPLNERVGFVDRKLRRLSEEVSDKATWIQKARAAYRSSFGYEYQGDSLFLARENLIQTYIEYYIDLFDENPSEEELKTIAKIIAQNVFQMDGLSYTLPYKKDVDEVDEPVAAKLMDWDNEERVTFESIVKGNDAP